MGLNLRFCAFALLWVVGFFGLCEGGYTLRVCIFEVGSTLLAGCCIVYLKFGNFKTEYTLRVGIHNEELGVRN